MQYEWAGEGQPNEHDRDSHGQPLLSGSLYVDGSCTTSPFHELRRAATTVVQWAADKPCGWRMQLPVPRPILQSSQSAEYSAIPLIKQFSHPTLGMDIASDCANVVRDLCSAPKAAMVGRRAYAGLLKTALADPAWLRRVTVRKVLAHVNPSSLPLGDARNDAVGNNMADLSAKEAVLAHPAPAPTLVQDLEAKRRRARYVVRTIAMVTQCFPRMPRERMIRPPPTREGARVAMRGGHSWVHVGGMWRCERCLRMTLQPAINGALAHERCPGPKLSMDTAAIAARGHTLARTDGLVPIIFCVKCGAWSTRRTYGLSTPCRQKALPAGRQALSRIAKGLQPWEDRHGDGDQRRRRGITCAGTATTTAAARRRRREPPRRTDDGGTDEQLLHGGPRAARRDEQTTEVTVNRDDEPTFDVQDVTLRDDWDLREEEDVFGFWGLARSAYSA
jgi:hypothetical protein